MGRGTFCETDVGRSSDPTNISEGLSMNALTVCPNFGTRSIAPTFLYASLSVSIDRMQTTISGLHAYGCGNAHFFLVFGEQKETRESEEKAKVSSNVL